MADHPNGAEIFSLLWRRFGDRRGGGDRSSGRCGEWLRHSRGRLRRRRRRRQGSGTRLGGGRGGRGDQCRCCGSGGPLAPSGLLFPALAATPHTTLLNCAAHNPTGDDQCVNHLLWILSGMSFLVQQ